MAPNTSPRLRNLVIYCVYVRAHTQQGTFRAILPDLDRIRSLGVDAIWFMPIHPIGVLNKKGSLGCPYSISDYRSVNPEYGTLEDFQALIQAIHARGMKVMIDVVYNHTAHDSILRREHPEFFHQDANGVPVTTVPEWSDVIDLKHPHDGLTRYLVDTLRYWSAMGVDGYRCDVASLVPASFWEQARAEVAQINPDTIWLAESVHASFVELRRQQGLTALSDSEIYAAFDLTYDYDVWPLFERVIRGQVPVQRLLEIYRFQHAIYPPNFIKMHYVENHDQVRIRKAVPDPQQALAWTAFQAFNDGAWLIYAGGEAGEDRTPSLFEKEPVRWNGYPSQQAVTRLVKIKKQPVFREGSLSFLAAEPVIQAVWSGSGAHLLGIFNVAGHKGRITVPIPDGSYLDQFSGGQVVVTAGGMEAPSAAAVLEVQQLLSHKPIPSELLD